MCGIVGIHSHDPVAAELLDCLVHLQHRGQDAAGILTAAGQFYARQGQGLVREIFSPESICSLRGQTGIGHVRYPTAGGNTLSDVQPLWTGLPRGIALAHNGNLVNYPALAREMTKKKYHHLNSSSDSEVLLHLLAEGFSGMSSAESGKAFFEVLCQAVMGVIRRAEGAWSVTGIVMGQGLFAFRDPHGIRPLVMGVRDREDGRRDYIFSSETTPFMAAGFVHAGDVLPGEVVFVDRSDQLHRRRLSEQSFSPCIFEQVYFARPDAQLDGVRVYEARVAMGKKLALAWKKQHPGCLPEVVVPVPFTSNTAAIAFAAELGVRYAEGLYKNPFIGRTFIMPNGTERRRSLRYKLVPQTGELSGRHVLVLDDSIVRGTTSREIVRIVREAGAREIDFVSACPPVRHPCFYGIDMPSAKELVAAGRSAEAIREWLGVSRLLYQSEEDLLAAVTETCHEKALPRTPCMACLNGCYVTGSVTEAQRRALAGARMRGSVE